MSRFLIVSPPLTGHVNPTIGIAGELTARGHEVAWVGSERFLRPLLGQDAVIHPTGARLYRPPAGQGPDSVRMLWQGFVAPFTRFTLPAVEQAVERFRPDLVLADEHAPAGALAAHRHSLPWATLATSAMELTRPFRALPKVEAWIGAQLAKLCADAGVDSDELPDPRCSPHLVVACTTRALIGPAQLPAQVALVGPILAERPEQPPFRWEWLDRSRRRVLVTMGTNTPEHVRAFYPTVLAALESLGDRVQGIVVADPDELPATPEHILVTPRVPMLDLLPQLDAVVCHGGMNTVCEALANAVPLVIGPLIADQPVTAAHVAAAGAGIRIRVRRADAGQLGTAIATVLDDPGYRAAAERIRASFAAAGGAATAAGHLEGVAEPPRR